MCSQACITHRHTNKQTHKQKHTEYKHTNNSTKAYSRPKPVYYMAVKQRIIKATLSILEVT